eukprot:6054064-Prymnesium_polylepis.1
MVSAFEPGAAAARRSSTRAVTSSTWASSNRVAGHVASRTLATRGGRGEAARSAPPRCRTDSSRPEAGRLSPGSAGC